MTKLFTTKHFTGAWLSTDGGKGLTQSFPTHNGSGGESRTDGSITSTYSFLQAGRPAADRAPRPDAVLRAAVPPRRAGAEFQRGVSSETADDVSPGPGGRNRGSRRSDGSRVGRNGLTPRSCCGDLRRRPRRGSSVPRGRSPARGRQKAHVHSVAYEAPIPRRRGAGLAERIERLLAADSGRSSAPGTNADRPASAAGGVGSARGRAADAAPRGQPRQRRPARRAGRPGPGRPRAARRPLRRTAVEICA